MKPAKKLPENATTMNPIMLIHQMRPGVTTFHEASVSGTPPNVMFTFKCTVDNEEFVGCGKTFYTS